MPLRDLFVDFNAYFASVEQQLRPELRGRPVIVVPVQAESTCAIAASYEARPFGIRTGTRVRDARRLCPGLRVVEARPKVYIQMHERAHEIIHRCLPVASVLSIDEMVCRLVGREQEPETAIAIAQRIKAALRREIGPYLGCSIGLAPNRLLAKVACDMRKPDGLTVIASEELPHALHGLKLIDFPGIGPRMERRFHRHGITTVEQLCRLTPTDMSRVWGSRVVGQAWWHHLRGEEIPETLTRRRSVGHSHVLPPDWRTDGAARAILLRLLHKAAARLRSVDHWAGSVTVGVSYLGRESWWQRQRITACQDTLSLLRVVVSLWESRPAGTPLKVGVVLGDLRPDHAVTRSLFVEDQRLLALAKAMDRVNRQFGAHAVYFGAMHGAQHRAGTRIAFNRIPDLALPDA